MNCQSGQLNIKYTTIIVAIAKLLTVFFVWKSVLSRYEMRLRLVSGHLGQLYALGLGII